MENRLVRVCTIKLKDLEDVAFARFCLLQFIHEDKLVWGYAPSGQKTNYEIGMILQEEDVPSARKVIELLDAYEIYNEAYIQ